MKRTMLQTISKVGCGLLLVAFSAAAQEHKWAGRTLDDLEQTVHERLAVLPHHGVFDTLRFEVQGGTVTLSGQVVKESVKETAERAVRRLDGVVNVVNRIEVLPSSRRDDVLRVNLYRAIYETEPRENFGADGAPPVHIIVKNGMVTLEGVVNSEAERGRIRLQAMQVTARVADNVRVATSE
jgi:osmotically-inducible protein OsmY